MTLRPYHAEQDESSVYALWQEALGASWPLSRDVFHHKTVGSSAYRSGDHFVALEDSDVVGFVATEARTIPGVEPAQQPRGEVMLVMVHPACQRRGIGRELLDCALGHLRERGATEAQLGSGGSSYFWPGVPEDLPAAWPFFEACGWPEVEPSFDLVGDLPGYATPPYVHERIRLPSVEIAVAAAEDVPAVLDFERRHFPRWLQAYETTIANASPSDIIVARDDADGRVLGVSGVMDFRDPWRRLDFPWPALLGDSVGGVGPLGVAPEARENGVGLALAARVTELLRDRGLKTSFVGYTWLVDWYGRLGYRVWRRYRMSWRKL